MQILWHEATLNNILFCSKHILPTLSVQNDAKLFKTTQKQGYDTHEIEGTERRVGLAALSYRWWTLWVLRQEMVNRRFQNILPCHILNSLANVSNRI